MKKSFIFLFISFAIFSCKDEEACTEEFRTISVSVKTFQGEPAQLDEIYWIDLSSKDTTELQPTESGVYTLADDNSSINGKATYRFDAYQTGSLVASEDYTLEMGECHIEKLSGKSTITLD